MEVRPARVGDLDALVTLMEEFYAESSMPLDRRAARAAFARLLEEPVLGHVWLCESDDQPVGYVVGTFVFSMEFMSLAAFLDDLFVRPAFRGRGAGRAAVDALVGEARARGVGAIHVECSTDETAAVRLYQRAGFREQKRGRQTLTLSPLPAGDG